MDIVSILPRNKNTLEFFYNLVCLKVCFFLLRWVGQLVVHILHEQPVRLQLYAESVSDVRPHFQLDYPSLSSLKRIGGCLVFPIISNRLHTLRGFTVKKWVFPKLMVPQTIHFNRVFHYKPSILGENPLFFWKHPNQRFSKKKHDTPCASWVSWKVLTIVNGEILSRTLVCLPNGWEGVVVVERPKEWASL